MKYLFLLLIFIPIIFIERIFHIGDSFVFLSSGLAIIPLAVILGDATEQISLYTGPKIGGMLNATMGNVPELLIGFFAVKAGLHDLVLASMAGSVIGNIMLVLGFSVLLGGLKYKQQYFNKNIARSNFTMLFFAAISFVVPYAFSRSLANSPDYTKHLNNFSLDLSIVLLSLYLLGLVFSLVTHKSFFIVEQGNGNGNGHDSEAAAMAVAANEEEKEAPKWSLKKSILILALATVFVGYCSEALVATVENATQAWGLSEVFVGIIIIPILGNVGEHASAIIMAVKNKVDISLEIAAGSAMQISLLVAPLLVIASFIIGSPMVYLYSVFQIMSLVIGIVMVLFIFQDGKTTWLEGLQLLLCYFMIGIAFFFL